MRKADYNKILAAAEDVKATRGNKAAHDKAIAKAKAAVDQSTKNQKADTKARQAAESAERRQAGRRNR